ncbi:MAG: hypothetical protein WCL53_03995, partial [Chloroflexota bacterium]
MPRRVSSSLQAPSLGGVPVFSNCAPEGAVDDVDAMRPPSHRTQRPRRTMPADRPFHHPRPCPRWDRTVEDGTGPSGARSRTDHPLTRPSVISLRQAFPADVRHRLDQAIAAAERLGLALWIVGGSVRDLAAGLPLRDLDLATNGPTSRLVARLAAALDARAHEEPRFGTASLIGADPTGATWTLDIARLRTERYVRTGALPTVTLGATIEADLARRDFSVNAMALPLTRAAASQGTRRGLVDPYGGLEDLAARRLRIL